MYRCIVYDEENYMKTINVNLDNEDEIWQYAKDNNLRLVSSKRKIQLFSKRKLRDKELKIFSKEMSILLQSGCDISNILRILMEQSNEKMKAIIKIISKSIEQGNSITEAFENTKAFSKFYISMIKAGEISGNLDKVMERLAIYYDKESKLKNKIMGILIYPAMLLICLTFSFLFILLFLVPTFEDIYADGSMSTPLLTKILILLSHLVRDYFIIIILINLGLIIGISYLKKNSKKFDEVLNNILFKTPVIKTYLKLIITSKFSKSLSILIWSGVQIVDSIDISAKVISNQFIYEKICKANEGIKRGNRIGESLRIIDEFPKLFISMIVIGEESGRLDEILTTITNYYDNELDSRLEIGTKYFENIITLIIGLVVALAMISMVLPMIDAVASI